MVRAPSQIRCSTLVMYRSSHVEAGWAGAENGQNRVEIGYSGFRIR